MPAVSAGMFPWVVDCSVYMVLTAVSFVVLVEGILCYQKPEVLLFNISNDRISHDTNTRSF